MPPIVALVASGLGVLGSLLWLWFFAQAAIHRDWAKRLGELPDAEPDGGWPSLAVVFAARDEEGEVERAARSMLALDYPALRLIAVDDRSRDQTGAILDRLAAEDGRLTVVHVAGLPPGWLGKTHALQAASEAADAGWLLFTDADVHFAPGALRRAVALAAREGIDHLTVAPSVPTETVGERLFLTMFQVGMTFGFPGWKVEDERSRAHLGIGAFNLVRAETLRAIGGFRRLALSIDDDVQLGRALKWAGFRSKVVLGAGQVSVRWQVGLRGMILGLEKNYFAASYFSFARVAKYGFGMLAIGVAPFVGLFVGPVWARATCALGVATASTLVGLVGGQSRIGPWYGLALPASAALNIVAMLRSTWLTLARGGVRWRGHLYPLRQLRDHVRRRETWMGELWRATRGASR
jgi:glycosyltransferase involved in cell wall biosynthesis